jgi:hypothetical protein
MVLLECTQDPERAAAQAFDRRSSSAETARITGSYVARVGAEDVRIARCGPYIWVRLNAENKATDLLFAPEESAVEGVPDILSSSQMLRATL